VIGVLQLLIATVKAILLTNKKSLPTSGILSIYGFPKSLTIVCL
jgi:hypothetical protein